MLDHLDLKPQGEYVTVPNGKQISQTLSLTDFHSINLLSLKPMMSFAKEHGHTFISDTTGYLARIHYEHDQPVYDFRIRACIEKNPIIDPFIQI